MQFVPSPAVSGEMVIPFLYSATNFLCFLTTDLRIDELVLGISPWIIKTLVAPPLIALLVASVMP